MKIDQAIKEDLKKVFQKELAVRKNRVTVFSPYRLSTEEMAKLKMIFPQIKDRPFGNEVDESLLAGVIIKYGTKMIDLSVKSRLNKIHSEII